MGFTHTGRAPMNIAGNTVPQQLKEAPPSIWLDTSMPSTGRARLSAATDMSKYPETKHTMKKVVHNITSYPVTERPGTESYDPVLLGGKSLVDHYPYAAVTPKEVLVDPRNVMPRS
mmetsp:Transcript_45519/g.90847  ORF Transcript_45519/g.90847 Transcript_45519/m.90847 type:complete len:116 (-) Transcript_45519:394-741(-)